MNHQKSVFERLGIEKYYLDRKKNSIIGTLVMT